MLTTIRRIMLRMYRAHEASCRHRFEGRKYDKCRCVWWVDGTIDGRRHNKSLRTRSREVALNMIREIEITGLPIPQAPSPETTVAAACEDFLADAKDRGLRQPTLYKYQLLFRRLKEFAEAHGLKKTRSCCITVDKVLK